MTSTSYIEWIFGFVFIGGLIGASLTTSVSIEVPLVFTLSFLGLLFLASFDWITKSQ